MDFHRQFLLTKESKTSWNGTEISTEFSRCRLDSAEPGARQCCMSRVLGAMPVKTEEHFIAWSREVFSERMTGEPPGIARFSLACYGQLPSIASRRSDLPPIQPANRPQTFPFRARPASAADSKPMEPGASSMRGQLALLSLGGQSGSCGARLASWRRQRHSSWSCSMDEAKRRALRLLVPGDCHQSG